MLDCELQQNKDSGLRDILISIIRVTLTTSTFYHQECERTGREVARLKALIFSVSSAIFSFPLLTYYFLTVPRLLCCLSVLNESLCEVNVTYSEMRLQEVQMFVGPLFLKFCKWIVCGQSGRAENKITQEWHHLEDRHAEFGDSEAFLGQMRARVYLASSRYFFGSPRSWICPNPAKEGAQ